LAVEHVHRHAADFDVVWWVEAEQADSVPEQIGALGEAMGLPPGTEPALVPGELRRRGARWLLVFDNAEDVRAVRQFRPTDGRGRVLVTSRRLGWGALGGLVEVPTLARAESVALLSSRVPGLADDADLADRIAELLGDLALAVEQAAAFCEETRIPPAEFADLLANRLEDVVELGDVAERTGVTVATLWELSVARLAAAEPAAVELLELLAFCGPEPVPLDLIAGRAELLGEGPLAGAAADRLTWARTLGALVGYSLAGRTTTTVSVHRLVQATTRRRTPDSRRAQLLEMLLRLLRSDLPGGVLDELRGWPRWRDLLPHVRAVIGHTPDPAGSPGIPEAKTLKELDDLPYLCTCAGMHLWDQGRAADALPLLRRALHISETLYSPYAEAVGGGLNNLALALQRLGRTRESLPLLERAKDIAESVHGSRNPLVATALINLAGALLDLDRPRKAMPLLERALAIDLAAYPPDHPEIATDLSSLAGALQQLGRIHDALPLYQRALAITEAAYPPEHPEVAIRLNNLAWALQHVGLAREALPLYRRALAIAEVTYSPDHPAVATRLSNMAWTLQTLGRADEAVDALERALKIAEAAHPPDHPSIRMIRNNLAAHRNALRR
jgi:tetratricopeptide (TPR) repeat protein